jgi:hypothetical protein
MSDKSKPAFPQDLAGRRGDDPSLQGMTLREYAAIKLRVPNSGDAELDAMILESRKLDYVGFAMQGVLSNDKQLSRIDEKQYSLERYCAYLANAMIAKLKQERGR